MNLRTSALAVVMGLVVIGTVVAQARRVQDEARIVNHHHYYGRTGVGAGVQAYGMGELQSGIGDRRDSTADAASIYAQTAHQVTQNHNYAVQSYYGNKDAHEEYVDAHRKNLPNAEELRARNKAAEPGRLSSTQFDRSTNIIHWPALLRESDFTDERQALDQLFHEQTADNSGADSENFVQIHQQCDAMFKTLGVKLRKEKLPSITFIGTEHFIKSLDYEGRFAVR